MKLKFTFEITVEKQQQKGKRPAKPKTVKQDANLKNNISIINQK